jgi:tetratricopeptide (TPR) repeat protein
MPTYLLAVFILSGFFAGCTTGKNTLVTRSYHNLTSHYNIFFNGIESYKKGLKQAQESYVDDYTQILPVFTYDDESIAQSIAPDMERTIKKSSKVIALHSITAKPEYKDGPQTEKQKDFYAKNEYNKWVDDNYLIMGKAYLFRHEYNLAIETFKFIITEYPYEDIIYETQMWLARAYNDIKEYKESEKILNQLTADDNFPKNLTADLYATVADLYMKREDYEYAIDPLTIALEEVRKKRTRIRYAFILGQLHQQVGNMEEASGYYREVIKMNPPYEMSINARINRASVFVEGGPDKSMEIKDELDKMLKDEKNREYQDQIYYALGNIYYREGNVGKAIDYYKLSSESSVSNAQQKTKSCLTLAEIFYERKDYESSKLYYDSAIVSLTPDYHDYGRVMTKSRNLSQLVGNLSVVSFEDSVQRLAEMSEADRLAVIDSIIARVRREEQEAQQMERQQMQDAQFNRMLLSESSRSGYQSGSDDGKWYFYNETAKSFGQPEFRMKWGNRKLEDNWRRKNKSEISFGELEEETVESTDSSEVRKEMLSNKTREYYIQDIPLTDSMKVLSDERIMESLFNAGTIYFNDLKDYDEAITIFTDLLDRYPDCEQTLQTYYNLYNLYNKMNNATLSNYYKESIIREFPESQIAQILTNPDYINELIEKENEVNRFYEATYHKYQNGNYEEVIMDVDDALNKYKDDELIPKFTFLKVLSIGETQDILTFTSALDSIINTYPNHEVSEQAHTILAYIRDSDPEVKMVTDKKEAEEIYTFDSTGYYYFGLVVNSDIDLNQLKFEIINFNLDLFPNKTFDVVSENLAGKHRLILVKSLKDLENAWNYYDQVLTNDNVFALIDGTDYARFIISPVNAETLVRDKVTNKYLLFFDKYYKRE